jgi:hypothetical protein
MTAPKVIDEKLCESQIHKRHIINKQDHVILRTHGTRRLQNAKQRQWLINAYCQRARWNRLDCSVAKGI